MLKIVNPNNKEAARKELGHLGSRKIWKEKKMVFLESFQECDHDNGNIMPRTQISHKGQENQNLGHLLRRE